MPLNVLEDLTAVYEPTQDGWWMASVIEYPGAFSQGATKEEARETALDAMAARIADRRVRSLSSRGRAAVVEPLPKTG